MYDNSELSCWNSLLLQWQSVGNDLLFWNKYWFANQIDPLHCKENEKKLKNVRETGKNETE